MEMDWTDISTLTEDQRGQLLDIIHDSHLAKSLGPDDPRQYILHDWAKQRELFDTLPVSLPHPVQD